MTDNHRAWQLVEKYLGGIATEEECVELEKALQASPDIADSFAQAARTEALLDEFFTQRKEDQQVDKVLNQLPRQPNRRWFSGTPFRWAAAAVLMMGVGIGLYCLPSGADAMPYTVVSGRVLVDGIESQQIHAGARVEVLGNQAAVIRLAADDSLVELSPSSKGILRGRMREGGQLFELTQGSCEFHRETGEGNLRVETPVGDVSGRGAEFAVTLRPGDNEEEMQVQRQIAMVLVVAVMAGKVDVQFGNDRYTLGLGDNRVYAEDKPAAPWKPDLTGKVSALADDGKSFTLETPPPAKKEPPGKRTVRLDEQTKLSYVNVPLKGEKLTVGYQARVWFAEGSTELAVAVTLGGQKTSAPEPDLAGPVLAVSTDGKEITLQLPRKTKTEPSRTVTVKLGDQTKLSYSLVPIDGEKPTVGYNASVWLVAGSKDTASAVTFSGKKGSVPNADWTGRVTAVSQDGKELTLQQPGKKDGTPATTAAVKIHDKTKLVYAGIDKDRQKPTVGFQVSVWLDKGSADTAASIRFEAIPVKKVAPAQPPVPKGDAKSVGFFAVPKGIELTAEQQTQLAMLVKELQPRYQKWLQKNDAVLTAEQKAALQIAGRAVKEAGLSDKQQIQKALAAAANITPEQQTQMEALAKEENELRQMFLDKLSGLLTPEQKAKLPKGLLEGKPVLRTKS